MGSIPITRSISTLINAHNLPAMSSGWAIPDMKVFRLSAIASQTTRNGKKPWVGALFSFFKLTEAPSLLLRFCSQQLVFITDKHRSFFSSHCLNLRLFLRQTDLADLPKNYPQEYESKRFLNQDLDSEGKTTGQL